MADDAPRSGTPILARGVKPCGLGARDTLRLEVCYPLHGNDIGPQTDAISAGLGWVVRARHGVHRRRRLREIEERGPERKLVAFRMTEQAIPGRDVDRGRRRGHVGLAVADARGRDRARICSSGRAARNRAHDRRPRPAAPRESSRNRSTRRRGSRARERVVSGRPAYHPEHDWARIEGDEAVLGITWFAPDALGELVHFEPPAAGSTVAKDASYGEVESVKAVSDVIAPLSGEVLEVNRRSSTRPRR